MRYEQDGDTGFLCKVSQRLQGAADIGITMGVHARKKRCDRIGDDESDVTNIANAFGKKADARQSERSVRPHVVSLAIDDEDPPNIRSSRFCARSDRVGRAIFPVPQQYAGRRESDAAGKWAAGRYGSGNRE
jgi:hypothetical protein